MSAERLSKRWVAWLSRHARAVALGALLVLAGSVYLIAYHLPIRADFSALLPEDTASVLDLHRIEQRVVAQDTVLVMVESGDPAARAAAVAAAIAARARRLPPELVSQVEDDDRELRDFLRAHRHLLAPLTDLEHVRDALAERLRTARLHANPLYIDSRRRPRDARGRPRRAPREVARRRRPGSTARRFVSADGRLQLVDRALGVLADRRHAGRAADGGDAAPRAMRSPRRTPASRSGSPAASRRRRSSTTRWCAA